MSPEAGGRVIAFAASGIVYFWEHLAAWYLERLELADSELSGPATDEPGQVSGEERARLASELAGTLLDSPQFRAAKAGARQRRRYGSGIAGRRVTRISCGPLRGGPRDCARAAR